MNERCIICGELTQDGIMGIPMCSMCQENLKWGEEVLAEEET